MELYALLEDYARDYLETIENATAEERSAATAQFADRELPEILSFSENGREAMISIQGVLSPNGPSPIARFFGFNGTAYNDIVGALSAVEANPAIETVRLVMDTPGGLVRGLDPARQAIERVSKSKQVIAENHGQIASAGYYLATAANRIDAVSPMAETGSIGVIIAGLDVTKAMERAGIKRVRIVSRNAPNKQPDPSTQKGTEVLQEMADATERVFIDKVAEGRGTTAQDVIDNFGKGGMLIAQDPDPNKPDAVSVGMIDSVRNASTDTTESEGVENDLAAGETDNAEFGAIGGGETAPDFEAATGGGQRKERATMDLAQLKAEYPALYQQAVEVGVKQEQDRASAHIVMGRACGDMELAVSCIEEGAELTPSVSAKYHAAGMNRAAVTARGDEATGDLDTDTAASGSAEQDEQDKQLAEAAAQALGVEFNA